MPKYIYTWESGIATKNPVTQKFFEEVKRMVLQRSKEGNIFIRAVDENNNLTGRFLITSPAIEVITNTTETGRYVKIKTRNSVYQFWGTMVEL